MGKKCYTKQHLYNVLLSRNQLDFFCEEKWLTPELKKKIKKLQIKKLFFVKIKLLEKNCLLIQKNLSFFIVLGDVR